MKMRLLKNIRYPKLAYSKCMEKLIVSNLLPVFNSILILNQHGFPRLRPTSTLKIESNGQGNAIYNQRHAIIGYVKK